MIDKGFFYVAKSRVVQFLRQVDAANFRATGTRDGVNRYMFISHLEFLRQISGVDYVARVGRAQGAVNARPKGSIWAAKRCYSDLVPCFKCVHGRHGLLRLQIHDGNQIVSMPGKLTINFCTKP